MRTILLYILLTFLPLAAFAQEVGEARFMRPLRHFQREVYEQRLPSARIDNLINYCMDNKQYDKLVRELPPLCDSILYFYHDTTAFLYSQPYLCSAFDRIGDVLGYEPYKNKMIPLLKGASDDVTNGFITLGSFYGKKHQPDSVAYFLKRAVHSYSLSHCAETDIYLAMQLMAAGMLHTRGEYTEAIHIASECATKYKTSTNDERNIRLADAYYIMAKSYLSFKKYKDAKDLIFKAQRGFSKQNEVVLYQQTLSTLGNVYLGLKQVDSAKLVITKMQKNSLDYLLLAADIAIFKHDATAEAVIRQGLSLSKSRKSPYFSGLFYHRLARFYTQQKRFEAAETAYQSALDAYSETGHFASVFDLKNRVEAMQIFTENVKFVNRSSETYPNLFPLSTIENSIQQADSLIDFMRKKDQRNHESKLFWREQVHTIYRESVSFYKKQHQLDKVFYYLEKNRAVLLLENLVGSVSIIDTKTVQRDLLTDSTAMIEYMVSDSSALALVLTKHALRAVEMPYSSEQVLSFINNAQKPYPNEPFYVESAALYQQLVAPLQLEKSIKRVIFSGDELLNALPFDALLKTRTPVKTYLIDEYATSYCYSATSLHEFQVEKQVRQHGLSVICFAPIDFTEYHLQSLPATKIPLDKLQSQAGSHTYYGKDATRRNFLKVASDANIVELYTHATATDSTEPQIYFAEGTITLLELSKMRDINADMIALTACQTAVGRTAQGEGVMSLAYGFANAGTPATMATFWSVPEISTVNIVSAFRDYLAEGRTKDEALRCAKIDYRDGRAPYFWAAPAIFGDVTPIPVHFINRYYWTLYTIAFSVFIFILLSFLYKIK